MEKVKLNRAIEPELKKYVVSSNSKYSQHPSPLVRENSNSIKSKNHHK